MARKCFRLVFDYNGEKKIQPRRYKTEKSARKDQRKLIEAHQLINKSPLAKEKLDVNMKTLTVEKC